MPSCSRIRALLDVQFDELVKAAGGQSDGFERTGESGAASQLFEAAAFLVAQRERLCGREHAGHHAAAEAADAEARWLFGGEDDEFDGTARLEPELLQNANGLEAAEHADASVVQAGVGNGVDVRAGADGRKVGFGAVPARKGVADGVFAHLKPGIVAQALDVGTARAGRPR